MLSYEDIKFLVNLLRHKLFGFRFPAHVALAVTNKCNLNCAYCYAQDAGAKGPDIPTDKMTGLIDELYAAGTRYIVLTGGEPLVRKDIKQIIDHIAGRGIKCSMSTNGLLLEDRQDALENLSAVNISLDGNEQQHIRNRGAQEYKKILNAIDIAVKRKMQVSIGNVVTSENMDCVSYTAKLAREKGCLCYFHIPYWRDERPKDSGFTPMTMEETSRVMNEIVEHKKAGYPISYSNRMHSYLRDWPYPHSILRKNEPLIDGFSIIPCLAGDCFCIIDADSSVYPCASMIGQVKALKALDVGFKKAWDFLPSTRCVACHFFLQNELNLLFSIDPQTWMNFLKTWPNLLRQKRIKQDKPSQSAEKT